MLHSAQARGIVKSWGITALAGVLFTTGCSDQSSPSLQATDAATTALADAASDPGTSAPNVNDAAIDSTVDVGADAMSDAALALLDGSTLRDGAVVDAGDAASEFDATVVTKTCTSPAVAYAAGMDAEGEHGYVLTLSSSDPAPPQVGYNTWLVTLTQPSFAPARARALTLKPFMPTHGHGAKYAPTIVDLGQGQYQINVHFSMPGYWRMTFAFDVDRAQVIDAGSSLDAATFDGGALVDAAKRAVPDETESTLHETIVLHLCI